ncbi:MAG TPA: hemerythrin domain-containing protein [Myxococcales bacterium]|nr:hemerythrin domain-containing protein [Myxococcales bacterium]
MIGNQERRRVLLGQHDRLRVLIAAVSKAAGEVLATPEDSAGSRVEVLRIAIGTLRRDLEDHLVTEEALLKPVLARIDAWGPIRLAQMHAEHAHHRALLTALRAERPPLEPHVLARSANTLATDVLAEMEDEERDLLAAGVLTDDPINLDVSDA